MARGSIGQTPHFLLQSASAGFNRLFPAGRVLSLQQRYFLILLLSFYWQQEKVDENEETITAAYMTIKKGRIVFSGELAWIGVPSRLRGTPGALLIRAALQPLDWRRSLFLTRPLFQRFQRGAFPGWRAQHNRSP